MVLSIVGRYDDAVADYRRALEMARSAGDRTREVLVLFRLSNFYWEIRQRDPMLECSRQALALARQTGDKFLETLCVLDTLGDASNFGPHSATSEEAEQTLSLAETTGVPVLRAFARSILGWVLQWQADFDRSLPHLNQAIELGDESHEGRLYGPSLLHLGNAYLSKGDYEEALRCSADSRSLRREPMTNF